MFSIGYKHRYSTLRELTEHLADVRLNVNVLQMLICVGMIEPQRTVQPHRQPDALSHAHHLTHLALGTTVSVKRFLTTHQHLHCTTSPAAALMHSACHYGQFLFKRLASPELLQVGLCLR